MTPGGVSLLDLAGKVMARVLQERLQSLVEGELPDSLWFQEGQLCGHHLHCASAGRKVMGAQIQGVLLFCTPEEGLHV